MGMWMWMDRGLEGVELVLAFSLSRYSIHKTCESHAKPGKIGTGFGAKIGIGQRDGTVSVKG